MSKLSALKTLSTTKPDPEGTPPPFKSRTDFGAMPPYWEKTDLVKQLRQDRATMSRRNEAGNGKICDFAHAQHPPEVA